MAPGKASADLETLNLRVYIHCEGCKRKVKKILYQVEGVDTVDVDRNSGKVTVTGIIDSKVLLKKLEKAGKTAEVLNGSSVSKGVSRGANGKEQQKLEPKPEKKVPKKVRFAEMGEEDKKSGNGDATEASSGGDKKDNKNGGDKKDNNSGGASNKSMSVNNGVAAMANIEEKVKKKSSGDGKLDERDRSRSTGHKNVTPMMIETGYSIESAEYATHMFSDENTDSCHIM